MRKILSLLMLALSAAYAYGEQIVSNMSRPIYTLDYDKDFNFGETCDVSRFVQTNDIIHDDLLSQNGSAAWTLCYKFVP